MTGVEILSSQAIYEVDAYWWLIVVFASVGLGFLGVVVETLVQTPLF